MNDEGVAGKTNIYCQFLHLYTTNQSNNHKLRRPMWQQTMWRLSLCDRCHGSRITNECWLPKWRMSSETEVWSSPCSINRKNSSAPITKQSQFQLILYGVRQLHLKVFNAIQVFQPIFLTSNRLAVTEVRSKSLGLFTEHRHNIGVLYAISHVCQLDIPGLCNVILFIVTASEVTSLWRDGNVFIIIIIIIVECGITRSRASMRVFNSWASSSPLGYPCAKFRFCHALHCW